MMKTDVIVVGAGLAGMTAALEAKAAGANVMIVTRGPLGIGSNTALSGARFAGPNPHYAFERYVDDTLKTGNGTNCHWMVQHVAAEASSAFSFLRSLGLHLSEFSMGYAVTPVLPDVMPGATLVRALAKRIREEGTIDLWPGLQITEILKEERVSGIRGIDIQGKEHLLYAPSVVLATGGAGAIYLRNDNQKGMLGQGYALAGIAGLELWDLEFVQFYPLVIAQPGLPSVQFFLPCHEETRLINARGDDLLEKYHTSDLSKAAMEERDELSAFLFREEQKGPVYMDLRRVPASFWKTNPWRKIKFDFTKSPLPISPAAHFFMGGVRIGKRAETSLPGLFACGEAAWGLHGADRLGGNALTECVVFGTLAGRMATDYAFAHPIPSSPPKTLSTHTPRPPTGTPTPLTTLRSLIREVAWKYAGVVRSGSGLAEGLVKLEEIERDLKATQGETPWERRLKEDLLSGSFVLKAVLVASVSREESRGSFKREDFPHPDNTRWRKNSCLTYDSETDRFTLTHPSCMDA